MRSALIAIAAGVALAGCASSPMRTPAPQHAPTYAEGFADGQRMERQRLADMPAFHIRAYVLAPCPDEVSSLPKDGPITTDSWWASRGRNIWLLKQCRKRDSAKRRAIIPMLDAVRK